MFQCANLQNLKLRSEDRGSHKLQRNFHIGLREFTHDAKTALDEQAK